MGFSVNLAVFWSFLALGGFCNLIAFCFGCAFGLFGIGIAISAAFRTLFWVLMILTFLGTACSVWIYVRQFSCGIGFGNLGWGGFLSLVTLWCFDLNFCLFGRGLLVWCSGFVRLGGYGALLNFQLVLCLG